MRPSAYAPTRIAPGRGDGWRTVTTPLAKGAEACHTKSMENNITLTPELLRAVAAALPTAISKEYTEGGRWEEYVVEHKAAASLRALAAEMETAE